MRGTVHDIYYAMFSNSTIRNENLALGKTKVLNVFWNTLYHKAEKYLEVSTDPLKPNYDIILVNSMLWNLRVQNITQYYHSVKELAKEINNTKSKINSRIIWRSGTPVVGYVSPNTRCYIEEKWNRYLTWERSLLYTRLAMKVMQETGIETLDVVNLTFSRADLIYVHHFDRKYNSGIMSDVITNIFLNLVCENYQDR